MILKGVATEGVKLLGTEVGAWLVDGINNDFQIVKNLVSHWTTITTGTIGGSATVAADTITLQQGTNSVWMAAYVSFSTVIGETYSVSGNILESLGSLGYVGAATTEVATPSTGNMDLGFQGGGELGLHTHTFTATTTTTYIYLISGDGATGFKVFKNEVEVRTAEIVTGAELVTNGDFATDSDWTKGTGWTIAAGVATHAAGTGSSLEQTQTPVVGESYILTFTVSAQTAGTVKIGIGGVNSATSTTNGTYTYTIVAINTNDLFVVASSAFDGSVDDVTVRLAIPDLSSVNMGLAIYGSLDKHVVNVNADTVSYSGFSATDYARQPYNSNLDFGTGGYHFRFWVKSTNASGSDIVFDRYDGSGNRVQSWVSATGNLSTFTTSAGTQDSGAYVSDNAWHHCVTQRRAGVDEIWVDSVNVLNTADAGSLTNANAVLLVGINFAMTSFADSTEIALFDVGPVSLTEAQILNIYNKEKILFERDSVHQVVDLGLDLNIERPSAINETPGGIRSSIPSDDGTARETIYQRRQKTHSASSGPLIQKDVKYVTNFLEAMNEGQAFSYDPYGAEDAPCDPRFVWLESASYQPVRDGDTNWFTTSFSMLERN